MLHRPVVRRRTTLQVHVKVVDSFPLTQPVLPCISHPVVFRRFSIRICLAEVAATTTSILPTTRYFYSRPIFHLLCPFQRQYIESLNDREYFLL
jgi:hypothetical protein